MLDQRTLGGMEVRFAEMTLPCLGCSCVLPNMIRPASLLVFSLTLAACQCGPAATACPPFCPLGEVCEPASLTCVPQCSLVLCGAGQQCNPLTGACVSVQGDDAGRNAGRPDAGTTDAGFDAGTPDAGFDPGLPDAGGAGTIGLNASHPSIAVTSAGVPHVAFLRNSYELHWAVLENGSWREAPIGQPTQNEYSAAIAITPNDQPVVAYAANYAVRLSRFDGGAWSDGLVYASAQGGGPFVHAQGAVVDSSGVLQLAIGQEYFQSSTYGSRVTLFSELSDGGWGQLGVADYNNNRTSQPSLALLPDGLSVSWITWYDGLLHVQWSQSSTWFDRTPSPAMCCGNSVAVFGAVGAGWSLGNTPTLTFAEPDGGWRQLRLVPDGGAGRVASATVTEDGGLHALFWQGSELLYRSPAGLEQVAPQADDSRMTLDRQGHPHVAYTSDGGLFYWTR